MSVAPAVKVVVMTADHLPAVAGLCAELGYAAQAAGVPARFRSLAANPDHGLFVALLDDAVVGFVHVHVRPMLHDEPAAQVQAMIVGHAHRRRGVGAMLLAGAEAWAKERGLATVMLYSADGREDANGFYAAQGYRPAAGLGRYDKALVAAAGRHQA